MQLENGWDIDSGLHVLSQIIQESIEYRPKFNRGYIKSTIQRLNNQIDLLLLSDEIPNAFMLMKVGMFETILLVFSFCYTFSSCHLFFLVLF